MEALGEEEHSEVREAHMRKIREECHWRRSEAAGSRRERPKQMA